MYQVEVDITFAKLLEIALTGLEAGLGVEVGKEPEHYLSQEMKSYLPSHVQAIIRFNVMECCKINRDSISFNVGTVSQRINSLFFTRI